jgi:hypothetical protein
MDKSPHSDDELSPKRGGDKHVEDELDEAPPPLSASEIRLEEDPQLGELKAQLQQRRERNEANQQLQKFKKCL